MKKIILLLFTVFLLPLAARGQQTDQKQVEYDSAIILDSDLDGLTDKGEEQVFGTNPQDPDSDGDGLLDGAEIIGNSNANDRLSPLSTKNLTRETVVKTSPAPWPWYFVRATGLVAFFMLYLSFVFGLLIRLPRLANLFSNLAPGQVHPWISLQATLLALFHGLLLVFDLQRPWSIGEIFIPFASEFNPAIVTLGIIGFYLMAVLVITSYLRKNMSPGLWRSIHYFNIFTYLGVSAHMLLLGTDMQSLLAKIIFATANLILLSLVVANAYVRSKKTNPIITYEPAE